jgi:hypothetical protein
MAYKSFFKNPVGESGRLRWAVLTALYSVWKLFHLGA